VSSTWSGQRKLQDTATVEASMIDAAANETSFELSRSLFTTQPNWCSFQGVTCGSTAATYASVTSIDLHSLGLVGTIPTLISNFHSLTKFDVSYNSLTGTIPSTISTWYNTIDSVQMQNNLFTGFIPSSIGTLTRLTTLKIASNSLTGTIPRQMSSLKALSVLKLENNFLTMGGTLRFVPVSTFSATTSNSSSFDISNNCLSYVNTLHPATSTSAKNCRPSSQPTGRKYQQ
jgi:Leucine rich repeat